MIGRRPTILTSEAPMCGSCGVGSYLNILPNGDVFPCHVLTDRAFACGSVRATNLRSICRREGLLGRLQALHFPTLAAREPALKLLATWSGCMATVYATTKALPIWQESLCSDLVAE